MADAQLVIDTDVLVDYLRGRGTVLRAAILRYECAITAITLYELIAVPVRSQKQEGLLEALRSVTKVLPFDADAANASAGIWRALGQQGVGIGLPDTLVAGTCLAYSLPFLTRNVEHFRRVAGLVVLQPSELIGQESSSGER